MLFIFIQKEWVKSWQISLKLITVDDNVKTDFLGFRDSLVISFYDIKNMYQMLAYDKLLDEKH
jgi:hypothetical protein